MQASTRVPASPVNPATHPTHVRYGVVAFAIALAVITYIDRVSISFAAPFIREDLHLSTIQMGWAFTVFAWAYALFEVPGGYLGDRIGPRKVLMRIVLWWSFFTAATGWALNFGMLAATRFLFGAGEAGCFPNLTKAFSAWLPPNEKVRAQGTLWMCARWGGAFTPPLVGLVMAAVGWRHAFEFFGLIGVVWAILFYRWYHDDPMRHPGLNEAERQLLRENAKLASTHGRLPWRNFLRARQTWLLCIQYFSHSYGFYFYITWLPTYLKDGRHMALTATALLSVLPLFFGGIGSSAGSLIAKPLARWTGSTGRARRLVALTGFAGACLFLTLSTAVANPVQAMLAIGLASFSSDLVMSSAWSATMDVGGKYAGTLSGAMNMWGNIGGSLSPIAIGFILAASNNWNLTFYLSAAVYLIGFTCWLFLDPVTPIQGAVEE